MSVVNTIHLSSGSLVDIDATLLIQLGVFIVMIGLLKKLLFGPVIRLVEARFDATEGALSAAKELEVSSKHSMETVAAREADVFTTVSEITALECEHLLGRRPDVVLPNGFGAKPVTEEQRQSAREELFASHGDELRAQIAEGVAAEERGELRDGEEAIRDVRRRIDERLRRGE